MKILIAENDELIAKLQESLLKQARHQIKLAFDGIQAFKMLRAENFDLVITEILLPFYTGLEVLHFVNDLEIRPKVIVLSSVRTTGTVYKAYQLNADLYITKPFDPDQLPREIEKVKI